MHCRTLLYTHIIYIKYECINTTLYTLNYILTHGVAALEELKYSGLVHPARPPQTLTPIYRYSIVYVFIYMVWDIVIHILYTLYMWCVYSMCITITIYVYHIYKHLAHIHAYNIVITYTCTKYMHKRKSTYI